MVLVWAEVADLLSVLFDNFGALLAISRWHHAGHGLGLDTSLYRLTFMFPPFSIS